jgi:UDP-galactopyranose mutase
VLYVWRDEFANAIDLVEHDFACYHIDDEYTFSVRDLPNSEREVEIIRRADLVIVHSPELLRKKGGINPRTVVIPNGADYSTFATPQDEPADIAAIPHPRIGYAGVIKKQLDLELLVRLVNARPNLSFVLVGPILNVSGKEKVLEALTQLPNVFLLGNKPAESLASYIQHFDVCLMCYEVNDYTRYIYPLKLNEYLATGRPTVSAAIETVKAFTSVVAIARSDDEWLDAIDLGLSDAAQSPSAREARQRVAQSNDWDALADRVGSLFTEGIAAKR